MVVCVQCASVASLSFALSLFLPVCVCVCVCMCVRTEGGKIARECVLRNGAAGREVEATRAHVVRLCLRCTCTGTGW
jgi:hypothetical protein